MIYYEELAYVLKEAAKFHDLMSASWKPRKASSVVLA